MAPNASDNEKQPDWFTIFLVLYTTHCDESKGRDHTLLHSVDSLRVNVNKKVNDDILREKLVAYTDTSELVVHGLYSTFGDSLYTTAKKLLSALRFGIDHDFPSIIETRKWFSPQFQGLTQNSSSTSQQQSNTSAFVFQVGSPLFRDKILSRANLLKNQNAQSIFGAGGTTPVYIRALWPKPVHELFIEAIKTSKSLDYSRPTVKNLRVCMSQTLRSELVPILSVNDLAQFSPLQVQIQSQITNESSTAEQMIS